MNKTELLELLPILLKFVLAPKANMQISITINIYTQV